MISWSDEISYFQEISCSDEISWFDEVSTPYKLRFENNKNHEMSDPELVSRFPGLKKFPSLRRDSLV